MAGEAPQFFINERQELVGGARVAVLDGRQNLRHLAHGL
jgi:hypothetical protein